MALTFRLFKPAICSCELFMQYDEALSGVERVHSYISPPDAQLLANRIRAGQGKPLNLQPPEVICREHQGLSGEVLFDTVFYEGQRKNRTWAIVSTLLPEITLWQFVWAFDVNRVLQIEFVRLILSTEQRQELQDACDIQFGPGLVTILDTLLTRHPRFHG